MRPYRASRLIAIFALSLAGAAAAQNPSAEAATKQSLADGTPIRMRLGRTVSSSDARIGDVVDLEVLDEVKVDDTVVIPKGATGVATVTVAEPKKMMGRGGKLDISVDSVKLVNGQKTALRAVKQSVTGGNQTSIFAAMAANSMSSAPLIFVRGKDITIPQGTEFIAYTNGEVPLELARLQPEALQSKAAASAFANSATELYFASFPDSAEIQIDGKYVGTTPSTVVVRAGEHKVAVRLAGFKTWHQAVTAAGTKLVFNIRMRQDGLNGSTVSHCSGPDCGDIPLGDIVKQKRDAQ